MIGPANGPRTALTCTASNPPDATFSVSAVATSLSLFGKGSHLDAIREVDSAPLVQIFHDQRVIAVGRNIEVDNPLVGAGIVDDNHVTPLGVHDLKHQVGRRPTVRVTPSKQPALPLVAVNV